MHSLRRSQAGGPATHAAQPPRTLAFFSRLCYTVHLPPWRQHRPRRGLTARIGLVRLANGPPRGAWCDVGRLACPPYHPPTSVMPAAWHAAFEASALAKQFGIPVKTLSTYAEITDTLAPVSLWQRIRSE